MYATRWQSRRAHQGFATPSPPLVRLRFHLRAVYSPLRRFDALSPSTRFPLSLFPHSRLYPSPPHPAASPPPTPQRPPCCPSHHPPTILSLPITTPNEPLTTPSTIPQRPLTNPSTTPAQSPHRPFDIPSPPLLATLSRLSYPSERTTLYPAPSFHQGGRARARSSTVEFHRRSMKSADSPTPLDVAHTIDVLSPL